MRCTVVFEGEYVYLAAGCNAGNADLCASHLYILLNQRIYLLCVCGERVDLVGWIVGGSQLSLLACERFDKKTRINGGSVGFEGFPFYFIKPR